MQHAQMLTQVHGIESALGRQDWDEVVFLAHQLKGATRSLAAPDIGKVLRNLESAGLRNSVEDVKQQLDLLGITLKALVN